MSKVKETRVLRSRILQYFTPEVLEKLKKIVKNRKINNNNDKISLVMDVLNEAGIDYDELGTGTNRTAVFIDGYVFKIALDKLGVRDNEQEFILSQELQPYVIKTYECNGIIMVCEYVVVISREEFQERKPQIRKILEDISQEYLLGDIGTIDKNFANWAFRDNGELVALDYAYIYRIIGDEMLCDKCEQQPMLEYTADYDSLICPHCRRKYSFIDIRRRIRKEMEVEELETSKERAYKLTQPVEYFSEEVDDDPEEQAEKYTFKFDLGDLLIFRQKQKEDKEMGKLRLEEDGREFETVVNLNSRNAEYNEDEGKSEDDILLEEIRMMMEANGKPVITVKEEIEDEPTIAVNNDVYRKMFGEDIPNNYKQNNHKEVISNKVKKQHDETEQVSVTDSKGIDDFFKKRKDEKEPETEQKEKVEIAESTVKTVTDKNINVGEISNQSVSDIDKMLQDIIDREDISTEDNKTESTPTEEKTEVEEIDPYQLILDAVNEITGIKIDDITKLKVSLDTQTEKDIEVLVVGDFEDEMDVTEEDLVISDNSPVIEVRTKDTTEKTLSINVEKIGEAMASVDDESEDEAIRKMIEQFGGEMVQQEPEPDEIEEELDQEEELKKLYAMAEEQTVSRPVIKIPNREK